MKKSKAPTAAETRIPDKANSTPSADNLANLYYVQHSVKAATAGLKLLPQQEWQAVHGPEVAKAVEILSAFLKVED